MNETSQGVRDAVGRCPQCGARVVVGQDWCSLCLQPLGVPTAADPEPEPDDADRDLSSGERSSGDLPPLVAEAMLAELAAATKAERPLARGPLAGMSRGMRNAAGCGAAVVLLGVLLLVLTLVGQLL